MIALRAGGRRDFGRPTPDRETSIRSSPSLTLPRVMGHRGAAGVAPENTLAGLRAAAAMGVSWIEFDVMLSGDGVPVLFHDDNLERITGRKVAMARTPFAELAKLDAGAWFGPGFSGEPIPSLEQALALAVELGLTPNIEIKPTPRRDAATAAAVVETVAELDTRFDDIMNGNLVADDMFALFELPTLQPWAVLALVSLLSLQGHRYVARRQKRGLRR